MALSPEQIAVALQTTRQEFTELFARAQQVAGCAEKKPFEVVALDVTGAIEAFARAIVDARDRGFYEELISLILDSGRYNGQLTTEVPATPNEPVNLLQAIANEAAAFTDPDHFLKGMFRVRPATGKVLVNGQDRGSGTLVGPNLFLTAWHVVAELFDVNDRPVPGLVSLTVEFDNYLLFSKGRTSRSHSTLVDTHADWYVTHSRCHAEELQNAVPDNYEDLGGFWDYAVIRLAEPCGFERRWCKLAENPVPPNDAQITIFQHAGGQPLKFDYGLITNYNPPRLGIPPNRFLHRVNAANGSSGGPCFDKNFKLVGIHQGKWPTNINGGTTNRGIPVSRIAEHITQTIRELPPPDAAECPVWSLGTQEYHPVVGLQSFQSHIWAMAMGSRKQIMIVSGAAGTGKTFTSAVCSRLLKEHDHLKLLLPASAISKLSALDFAAHICREAGGQLPGIIPFEENDSTYSAWNRDILLPAILQTLDQQRDGRTVWVMITELNKSTIDGDFLSELLMLLYQSVLNTPWLRIVLDGMQTSLPADLSETTLPYLTQRISEEDVRHCLAKMIAEYDIGLADVAATSAVIYSSFQTLLDATDEATALRSVKTSFNKYLLKALQPV